MTLKIYQLSVKIPHKTFKFPGGELSVQVNVGGMADTNCRIECTIRNSDDIMELLLVTDAIRRGLVDIDISLRLDMFPYSRQDRVCNPGEALSTAVMANLINAQKYKRVHIVDSHSDVALALINNVNHLPQWGIVSTELRQKIQPSIDKGLILVAPDAGALKKVMESSKKLGIPFVRADKTRDPKTGAITGTVVYSEHVGNSDFLILDDICDGGRTFVELAKVLRPLTNGRILLYVTHGLFTQGTAVFDGVIDHVYVANSMVKDLPANFTPLWRTE